MKCLNRSQDAKYSLNLGIEKSICETCYWKEEVLDNLNCDELFFVELKKNMDQKLIQDIKKKIYLRGCERR